MSELLAASPIKGQRLEETRLFLARHGVKMGDDADYTVLLMEGDAILAAGSLCGNVLKYVAVEQSAQGEGACARIVSELVSEAYRRNRTHLFLYTKPENAPLFRSLGFYDVIAAGDIAMLENRRGGLDAYLASLSQGTGRQGAVVMNCAPFTLGHRYLVEEAAKSVDTLHLFVVSQAWGPFSPEKRFAMVKAGTADILNILLHECGSYLVSAATFPTYFIKEQGRAEAAQADLDIALFCRKIAPALSISVRFVGTEPYCPVTARYNIRLAEELPRFGIELVELPRRDGISASEVRRAMAAGNWERVRQLVPQSTYDALRGDA
ncbi:MAG: [citrate (pro-3S)-lyase] ligase [Clostridia bacterium]|nr:[citrate (pro-3S)-lyase] ligase [Candidatus Pelethousia sp.]NCB31393.1 [citrate (pro-3S)-lyase] ligase [Clostridia bacterium]